MVIAPACVLHDITMDIHNGLLVKYDCKYSAPPPAQPGARARPGRDSQDGVSQQQETAPIFLPQLNRLHEVYIVRRDDVSNVAVVVIPTQHGVTQQIITVSGHCRRLRFVY